MKLLILSALFIATVLAYSSSSSSSSECSEENDGGNNDTPRRRNDGGGASITVNNVQVMGSSEGSRRRKEDDGMKCEAGWKKSHRKKGVWCLKVYGGTVNLEQATNECANHNAVVSSVENSHERNYIIEKGQEILSTYQNVNYGSFWIGGQRVKRCRGNAENNTGCVPWANHAYEWTDGFTTGKKMMRFRPGQPDYQDQSQNSIYMHIVYRQPTPIPVTSGDFDDIESTEAASKSLLQYVRGYVCGKKARRSH